MSVTKTKFYRIFVNVIPDNTVKTIKLTSPTQKRMIYFEKNKYESNNKNLQ